MKVSFDPNLLSELIDQSHHPPGSDQVLGNFYAALVEMVEQEQDQDLADILMNIKKKRHDITNKHFINLIFRTFQAMKIKRNDLTYRSFHNTKAWHQELNTLLLDKDLKKEFKKLLLTKSTTTTIYQRYAGPHAVIALLLDNKNVSIADFGCGGNYGLRGIEKHEPFKDIKDLTPKKIVSKLLSKKINIKKGLAIDKEQPDTQDSSHWRMACSFYPSELDQVQAIQQFEIRIQSSQKVAFLQRNLLTAKRLPKIKFDVVILSTILYQLNLLEQLAMIEKAKRFLKPAGIIIVQDFAAKSLTNPRHLDFNDSWFGKSYSYRTFIIGGRTRWKFWEILQWNNGRCKIVRPGEDFNIIF